MIPIGKIIQEQLKEQNKTVVWFAKQMPCSRTKIYSIFNKHTIDSNYSAIPIIILSVS